MTYIYPVYSYALIHTQIRTHTHTWHTLDNCAVREQSKCKCDSWVNFNEIWICFYCTAIETVCHAPSQMILRHLVKPRGTTLPSWAVCVHTRKQKQDNVSRRCQEVGRVDRIDPQDARHIPQLCCVWSRLNAKGQSTHARGVCHVSASLPFLSRPRNMSLIRWSDGSKSGRNLSSTRIPNNTLTFHFTRAAFISASLLLFPLPAVGKHPAAPCTMYSSGCRASSSYSGASGN